MTRPGRAASLGWWEPVRVGRLPGAAQDCGHNPSMSKEGDCWEDAVVERLFFTLKRELLEDADWATREDVRVAPFEGIERRTMGSVVAPRSRT